MYILFGTWQYKKMWREALAKLPAPLQASEEFTREFSSIWMMEATQTKHVDKSRLTALSKELCKPKPFPCKPAPMDPALERMIESLGYKQVPYENPSWVTDVYEAIPLRFSVDIRGICMDKTRTVTVYMNELHPDFPTGTWIIKSQTYNLVQVKKPDDSAYVLY